MALVASWIDCSVSLGILIIRAAVGWAQPNQGLCNELAFMQPVRQWRSLDANRLSYPETDGI